MLTELSSLRDFTIVIPPPPPRRTVGNLVKDNLHRDGSRPKKAKFLCDMVVSIYVQWSDIGHWNIITGVDIGGTCQGQFISRCIETSISDKATQSFNTCSLERYHAFTHKRSWNILTGVDIEGIC